MTSIQPKKKKRIVGRGAEGGRGRGQTVHSFPTAVGIRATPSHFDHQLVEEDQLSFAAVGDAVASNRGELIERDLSCSIVLGC
jgi:hypothetical protein